MCGLINQIVSPGVSSNVFLFLPGIPPPFPVMLKDSLHLGVEEAVWEGHGEALGGQQDGAEVSKDRVGDGAGWEGREDGDEVGDAQQRDDHQQGLGRPPVLVVRALPLPCGPQLGHHHVEDGDEEKCVGGQHQQYRPDVDPLVWGRLHEGTVVQSLELPVDKLTCSLMMADSTWV